jgi:hypothetical protein
MKSQIERNIVGTQNNPVFNHNTYPEKLTVDSITRDGLICAQNAWIRGFLAISSAHRNGNNARDAAIHMIEQLYDYARVPVLFKPTCSFGNQTFRNTFAGAVSYFVAGDPSFPLDKGFALADWIDVYMLNNNYLIDGNVGMSMGNFIFVKSCGFELRVEKTLVFRRDEYNNLRIVLHHSALPFKPESL